jgi:hypothetical protein
MSLVKSSTAPVKIRYERPDKSKISYVCHQAAHRLLSAPPWQSVLIIWDAPCHLWHSEALGSTQERSEALRGTQRHTQILTCTKRPSASV